MTATRYAPVLLVAGLLPSSCGVPTEDTARQVPPPSPRPAASVTVASPTQVGPAIERLYLVKNAGLTAVDRHVRDSPDPAVLLRDLFAGPTPDEQAQGLTSAVSGTEVPAVHVSAGQATVELPQAWESTGRTDDVLAFGQIVCSLTSLPGLGHVVFTRAGQRISVPDGNGVLTHNPVSVGDYASLVK